MSEYTAADAHAAVERGAAWLDEECPDWLSKINLEALDLGDSSACMLGQTANCIVGPAEPTDIYVGAGYWRVINAKNISNYSIWAAGLGFDVTEPELPILSARWQEETDARYEMLTIAWKEYIRERLAVGAAA